MGAIEQNIVAQSINSGEEIPERIANAPEVKEQLAMYLQAFFDLDSERQQGFGLSRIPWRSIQAYGEIQQYDEFQLETLHYVIRAMDIAYLKHMDQKEKP